MIEKVKVCAFSEQVKGDLARSSGALTSLSLRKPWKAMFYSITKTTGIVEENVKCFAIKSSNFVED